MKRLLALFLLCLSGSAFTQTAAEPEAPDAWMVRTFQFPMGYHIPLGEDYPDKIALNTPSSEVVKAIKSISAGFVNPANPQLSQGSAGIFDKRSGTYVLRTTETEMKLAEACKDALYEQVPQHVVSTLHLIQADSATLRQAAREASTLFDHHEIWKRLEGRAQQGLVKPLNTLRMENRSGQRVRIESTRQVSAMADLTLDTKGRMTWDASLMAAGALWEMETVIGPDGRTLDSNFMFEYHFASPSFRNERVTASVISSPLEIPVTDFYRVQTITAISCESGNTKLIGIWKPSGTAEFEGKEIMQAAFLHTEVVKLLPVSNKDLEKIFLAHVDKAIPLPEQAPAKVKPPKGMEIRSFEVPPDFLSLGNSLDGVPADPFAPKEPGAKNEQSYIPPVFPSLSDAKAMDILKAQGIPFPEGSSAIMYPAAKRLIVINKPENLDQVEAFTCFGCGRQPLSIALALHLIQADGTTIRQIAADNAATSDQAEALLSLEKIIEEGKAKSLQVLRLETRSGQRANTEVGPQWTVLESAKSDAQGNLTFHHEHRPAGTRFEVDPVIGPDGFTLELNLALEHHFAPPVIRNVEAMNVQRPGSPETDFHFAKVTTSITLHSGMTKLIGIWTPEGVAEFEGKDFMQAAFLTATIVQPMTDKKP